MRGSFNDNSTLSEPLFDLLDLVFPGLRALAQNARALGAPWESVSTPFFSVENDQLVSHVGVIEIPLILAGQKITVGSLHAVATHPAYRRRGYYRHIMEEVLTYCADRYETLILTTEHPEYFEPFGFRRIQEHLFTVQCRTSGDGNSFRLLDTQAADDLALLHRLLETRSPLSHVVGVINEKAVFCFNEGSRPLYYEADLDVLVCLEWEGTKLKLFDIVGPKVPPLATLLKRLPQPVEAVDICFSPDRLQVEAKTTPYLFDHDGPSYLMVRGPFAPEGQAFSLPRSART
jgi:predicted N-acetyltransferase YhbS